MRSWPPATHPRVVFGRNQLHSHSIGISPSTRVGSHRSRSLHSRIARFSSSILPLLEIPFPTGQGDHHQNLPRMGYCRLGNVWYITLASFYTRILVTLI